MPCASSFRKRGFGVATSALPRVRWGVTSTQQGWPSEHSQAPSSSLTRSCTRTAHRRFPNQSRLIRLAAPRGLDGGDVDLLHRHHRLEGTLRLVSTRGKRIGQRARGDLPGEAPAIPAPTALTLLTAVADDRVPVAVGLFLVFGRDLEGKGLTVLERRSPIEAQAGNAQNGELHRQLIALLAAGVVTGRPVNRFHFTIREGSGVKARRLLGVLVEPETDRVLWLHVPVLLLLAPA